MKTYTSIQEWLNTNPSKEELTKVLNVVNKSVIHQIRHNLNQTESILRKLNRSKLLLEQAKFTLPKELTNEITNTKKKIEDLKKQLPPKKVVKKVEKKVEVKVEEVKK